MQILVVEDEQRMADLLERALSEEGHRVVVSRDGREGYEIARTSPFDVILLDVMLPGTDGISISRRLRENKVQTPILMLTARDTSADIIAGLDSRSEEHTSELQSH